MIYHHVNEILLHPSPNWLVTSLHRGPLSPDDCLFVIAKKQLKRRLTIKLIWCLHAPRKSWKIFSIGWSGTGRFCIFMLENYTFVQKKYIYISVDFPMMVVPWPTNPPANQNLYIETWFSIKIPGSILESHCETSCGVLGVRINSPTTCVRKCQLSAQSGDADSSLRALYKSLGNLPTETSNKKISRLKNIEGQTKIAWWEPCWLLVCRKKMRHWYKGGRRVWEMIEVRICREKHWWRGTAIDMWSCVGVRYVCGRAVQSIHNGKDGDGICSHTWTA